MGGQFIEFGEKPEVKSSPNTSSRIQSSAPSTRSSGIGPGTDRDTKKASFAHQAGELNLEEIKEALKTLVDPREPAQIDWHRALIRHWASVDPEAAMSYSNGVMQPKLRYDSQADVLEEWARTKPAAAWTYVTDNPDQSLSGDMYDQVLEGLGRADPAIAFQFTRDYAEVLLKDDSSLRFIVSELYQNGSPKDIVAQIDQLPSGPLREASSKALVGEWARYDPDATLSWIEESQAKGELSPEATSEAHRLLAKGWGRVDPLKAIEWVGTLPPGEASAGHLKELFSTWMRIDEDNAAKWLVDQPRTESNDQLVDHYTRVVVDRDPAVTMLWADSIVDPERREEVKLRVSYFWEDLDPDGWKAHQAAQAADVPPND
jgi:hypothetical protein